MPVKNQARKPRPNRLGFPGCKCASLIAENQHSSMRKTSKLIIRRGTFATLERIDALKLEDIYLDSMNLDRHLVPPMALSAIDSSPKVFFVAIDLKPLQGP